MSANRPSASREPLRAVAWKVGNQRTTGLAVMAAIMTHGESRCGRLVLGVHLLTPWPMRRGKGKRSTDCETWPRSGAQRYRF